MPLIKNIEKQLLFLKYFGKHNKSLYFLSFSFRLSPKLEMIFYTISIVRLTSNIQEHIK